MCVCVFVYLVALPAQSPLGAPAAAAAAAALN